jgi:N12 class adenine-specific DNA methylase
MSVDWKARQIYNAVIHDITSTENAWRDVLRLAGKIYRFEFDNVVMIYAQKPHASLVADYDTWKKVDRYVQRGAKGAAIFPSHALASEHLRYVFDIRDTGGRNRKLTWELSNDKLEEYVEMLVGSNQLEMPEYSDTEALKNVLKDFTKHRIGVIIKEDFAERMTDVKTLTGRVIKGSVSKTPEAMAEELIEKSIFYVVATRCDFDLSSEEQDFKSIVDVAKEDQIYALGSLVCDVACIVLREFSRNLARLEQERRMSYGRAGTKLLRGERSIDSEHRAGTGGLDTTHEVRTSGDGLSEGSTPTEVSVTTSVRETDGGVDSGAGGSKRTETEADGEVYGETQAGKSTELYGETPDYDAGRDADRGDRSSSNRESISLEVEEELNRELSALEAGERGEAEFHQASLFDFMDVGTQGSVMTELERQAREKTGKEYTYLNPKIETEIPHDYIVEALLHGSGFVNGKKRIYEMYQNIPNTTERAAAIKKEYGTGGAGWPIEGYGLHGYDTFKSKGLRLQWRDEEGEKEGYLSWRKVEAELGVLVMLGEYYQPVVEVTEEQEKTRQEPAEDIEIEVEVNYEVPEENMVVHRFQDGELVRVTNENRDLEDDGDIVAEEVVDELTPVEQTLSEFAIPDEMEDMGTPDYLKAEEALATYEEYADESYEETSGIEETKDGEYLVRQQNYHLPLYQSETGFGAKTRFGQNVEAIKLLKQIEDEGRNATPKEQETLAKYIGWGGLAQAFDEKNESWSAEYQQLKELLTPAEYETARASVNNAFYTPTIVASSILDALTRFGFKQGNILEPSMGIGNFFGCMPASFSDSKLYGVELDNISARIGKLLYPKAKIENKGFEETSYPDNFFDAVVGNVPFGDYRVYDPKYAKLNFKIHDYFIAKAIDQVRPGGMVAVITTKGTLDKQNATVRKYFAERAELVGAIRLPSQTFKDNAGTEVTSDILFFQKRERKESIEPDWVHLGFTENGIPVNQYFVEYPEMMLGTMAYDKGRFGDDSNYTICVNDDENFHLYEALQNAIRNIHAQMKDFDLITDDEEKSEEDIPADPDVKNYTYTLVDGKLYYRKDSRMFLKKAGGKLMDRIKGLNYIRECVRKLIDVQLDGCTDEALKAAQKKLNESYDAYVKKNGFITSKANASAFRDDADYPLLCSLEVVDEDGKVSKADIFTKQTIRARQKIDYVETAVEALNISINEFNAVNLPYMLTIYTPDISDSLADLKDKAGEEVALSESATREQQREKMIEELKGVIFLNPDRYNENDRNAGWETADEYLSGNVRDKLHLAQAYASEKPELFGTNVEALEQVQPQDLTAAEIDVRIGTTWIEPEDYEQFIYELLDTPYWSQNHHNGYSRNYIAVRLNKFNMEWFVENKSRDNRSVAARKTYGTSRMDAYAIFENLLNLRTITIRDRIDDGGGKYHYELNKNETMLAREKANQIQEAFKNWIWEEPERRQKYVTYYNETFNNVRLREYDGSHLDFPGMNPDIHLNPHQANAVARVIMGGNTLLAHCVGAGKSFEMMAACMEQKRLGLANKTVMVVPKSLVGQTASEFLRLYPSANILVATEHDFSKAKRQQFIARIATGDYDCIIMSHSQFEKIPVSEERRKELLNRQIDDISYAIAEMKERNEENWTVKQMEAQKKRLEEQLKELTDTATKDDLITFEELGIDSIMVDEAHTFKNLSIFSKMNNVSGITGSGSKRAMDMFLKCQYITELNGGRGVVFATGTPISNTMCEMYVMQSFLQKDTLEQMGIYHFDSWAANFGEVTTALELTVEGSGFRFKSRFNKFTNLPELMNLFKEVADIQTRDMLDLDVPELRDGKYVIVESEPDWYTKMVMDQFVERAERIRGGGVDPSVDNFLKITHDARLLGTDARLLDPDAPNSPEGKLNKVVENIYYEYEKAKQEGIIGTQLVFSDIGTPKSSWKEEMLEEGYWSSNSDGSVRQEFDIYNYIKTELVKKGIPAEEIAFIHDAPTDAKKDSLFRDMRTGTKKVLIGSTEKCGTGVNVQTHLVAMHHVDCPWKPSSIEQREGRGLRQGNENESVAVYRYVTKGTFDAYSWSLVENKQRFISQVMTSKTVSRSCEDIDEATLSYAEIKAVATGNPLIKEKMELDNDVQRLKLLKSSYDSQHYALQDAFMVKYPKLIATAEEKLACVHEDVKARDAALLAEPDFAIKVGNMTFTERTDGGTAMLAAASKCKNGETTDIGEYKGFTIAVEKNFMGANYIILRGKTTYRMDLSTSPVGSMVRLENTFHEIQTKITFFEQKLEEYHRDMEAAKRDYERPFEHAQELEQKLKRQFELNTELDLENKTVEDVDLTEEKADKVAEPGTDYKTQR